MTTEFRAAVRSILAASNGNVSTFLAVLRSKLTQQDRKEYEKETSRGGPGNIYRLGLLFKAADKVEASVRSYLDRDDAEAMTALKSSLQHEFNSNFPPLKNVLKQIEVWETKKKPPSLVK